MIVHSNGQYLFGFILANHILVQKFLDLLRLQQINPAEIRSFAAAVRKFLFQNLRTKLNTVITDIYIIRTSDQLSHLILGFPAKRAADLVVLSAWHTPTSIPYSA